MFKNKNNLILITVAVAVVVFLFARHASLNSDAIAKTTTTKSPVAQPLMIEATIIKIDSKNHVLEIFKDQEKRNKIIFKKTTPIYKITKNKLIKIKATDLKIGEKIAVYVGYHPTKPDAYLGGFIVDKNVKGKTVAEAPAKKLTSTKQSRTTTKSAVKSTSKKVTKVATAKSTTAKTQPQVLGIKVSSPGSQPATGSANAPAFGRAATALPIPNVPTSQTTPAQTSPRASATPPATVSPPTTPTPPAKNNTAYCSHLPAPTGATVTVSDWKQLKKAVNDANANGGNITILLEDGDYTAEHFLFIYANNVSVRGKSGNRDKVIIKSPKMRGGASHIFGVIGSNVTIADMSIGQVANHVIQVFGEKNADNLLVHNVRLFDSYEQLLKVSTDNKHKEIWPANGIIECSLFEYTAGVGPQWYIGGIDAHNAHNWIVRDNVFKNIISPTSNWAEHAIHFWNDSEGTLVERNVIINSDRGIGFGLGDAKHKGGIIRNNMIYHNSAKGDVGIGLENANGAKVYNNTIFFEHNYPNAIEYRFAGTSAEIYNNLTNKKIQKREGDPVGDLQNNFTNALAEWFVNPATGNLRLTQRREEIVEHGKIIDSVITDIDGDKRPQGNVYDIGADEWK